MRCIGVFGARNHGKTTLLRELIESMEKGTKSEFGVLSYGVLKDKNHNSFTVAIHPDGDTDEKVEEGFLALDELTKKQNIDFFIFATHCRDTTPGKAAECANIRGYQLEWYEKNKTDSSYMPEIKDNDIFRTFAETLSKAEAEAVKAQIFFLVNQKQKQN